VALLGVAALFYLNNGSGSACGEIFLKISSIPVGLSLKSD